MSTSTLDRSAVTDENIDDMIDVASYGIEYWARDMTPEEKAKAPEGAVCMFAEERFGEGPDVLHYLTREQIREAYFRLLDLDQSYVNKLIHGYFIASWQNRDEEGIDAGQIDAWAGDALLQVAALGEVVYG